MFPLPAATTLDRTSTTSIETLDAPMTLTPWQAAPPSVSRKSPPTTVVLDFSPSTGARPMFANCLNVAPLVSMTRRSGGSCHDEMPMTDPQVSPAVHQTPRLKPPRHESRRVVCDAVCHDTLRGDFSPTCSPITSASAALVALSAVLISVSIATSAGASTNSALASADIADVLAEAAATSAAARAAIASSRSPS